jgi:uncharacterized membrane protein YidH (DUF202 family)
MAVPVVLAAVSTVTGVAGTISQISDAQKRREFEQAMGRLNADEKIALDRQLGRAKTQAERLAILTNAVGMIRAAETTARLQNIGKAEEAKRKKEMITIFLIVGGGLALITTVILLKKL